MILATWLTVSFVSANAIKYAMTLMPLWRQWLWHRTNHLHGHTAKLNKHLWKTGHLSRCLMNIWTSVCTSIWVSKHPHGHPNPCQVSRSTIRFVPSSVGVARWVSTCVISVLSVPECLEDDITIHSHRLHLSWKSVQMHVWIYPDERTGWDRTGLVSSQVSGYVQMWDGWTPLQMCQMTGYHVMAWQRMLQERMIVFTRPFVGKVSAPVFIWVSIREWDMMGVLAFAISLHRMSVWMCVYVSGWQNGMVQDEMGVPTNIWTYPRVVQVSGHMFGSIWHKGWNGTAWVGCPDRCLDTSQPRMSVWIQTYIGQVSGHIQMHLDDRMG